MTIVRKTVAALLAACIAVIYVITASASPADYDMSRPQELSAGHLYAQSALLIDEDSGEVLFSKDSRIRMYPASTTKIMTLLLGLESGIALDEQVTVPEEAGDIPNGSSVIPVKPGDQLAYGDLLTSFMLSSGNDGANAVAVLVDGSIDAFVAHMNARAQELGLEGTHYVNAHGYHEADHYTTAEDLAKLARAAMQNATFREIVRQPSIAFNVTRGGETKKIEVESRNSLLLKDQKYYYPECTGIKTGHHNKAGWCFVGSAERDGMRVICVVLNCEGEMDKWYDAARLFEYGFTRYEDVAVQSLVERAVDRIEPPHVDNAVDGVDTVAVALGEVQGGEATLKVVSGSDTALQSAATRVADGMSVEWTRALEAPISAGEELGIATFALPGGGEATVRLVADRDVAAQPTEAPTEEPVETDEPVATRVPSETEPPADIATRGVRAPVILLWLVILLALSCAIASLAIYLRRKRKAALRRARKRRAKAAQAKRLKKP